LIDTNHENSIKDYRPIYIYIRDGLHKPRNISAALTFVGMAVVKCTTIQPNIFKSALLMLLLLMPLTPRTAELSFCRQETARGHAWPRGSGCLHAEALPIGVFAYSGSLPALSKPHSRLLLTKRNTRPACYSNNARQLICWIEPSTTQ